MALTPLYDSLATARDQTADQIGTTGDLIFSLLADESKNAGRWPFSSRK